VERKVDTSIEQTDTGNERKLGQYIHDMAQTQEILSAQLHTNTRELVMSSEKADQAVEVAREVEASVQNQTSRIEAKLDEHIEGSAKLVEEIAAIKAIVEGAA
jgi:hypothetical protein